MTKCVLSHYLLHLSALFESLPEESPFLVSVLLATNLFEAILIGMLHMVKNETVPCGFKVDRRQETEIADE